MQRFAPLLLTAFALGSCAPIGDAWRTGWTERAASDQIMLVSNHPSTLGRQRLDAQSRIYPDLGKFLTMSGWPDFLAETSNSGRRYLILYYVDRRQAFAARTRRPDNYSMEFAGPYPISDRENAMFKDMKRSFKQQTGATR